MQLIFLGTGSQYPSKYRGASCTALKHDNGDIWLFDCGEGTQIQLQRSNLRPGKITKIFITHLHGDHIFGLPGLLCSIGNWVTDRDDTLDIYGPCGLRFFLQSSLSLSCTQMEYKFAVHEMTFIKEHFSYDTQDCAPLPSTLLTALSDATSFQADSSGVWHIYEDDRLSVLASLIVHTIPCFGYVISEKPLPGKLDPNKLMALDIQPGPLYGKIKNGESVQSPNGRLVMPSEVLGPPQPGRKITILGDTCDPAAMIPIAMDSNVLVHESTVENALKEHALKYGHSTPEMAAQFAMEIKAKTLILTHFSQRYGCIDAEVPDKELRSSPKTIDKKSVGDLLDEARKSLVGECVVFAAEDFFEFSVPLIKM